MKRVDLAAGLGISTTMVRRLERRGMPVDSVAAARLWRARHLDTLRTKQYRAGGNTGKPYKAAATGALLPWGWKPRHDHPGVFEANMLRSAQLFVVKFGVERFGALLVHLGCVMSEEGHDVLQQARDRGEWEPGDAIDDDAWEAISNEYFALLPVGGAGSKEVQFGD